MLWAEFVAKGISSSNEDLLRERGHFYMMKYLGNISYLSFLSPFNVWSMQWCWIIYSTTSLHYKTSSKKQADMRTCAKIRQTSVGIGQGGG